MRLIRIYSNKKEIFPDILFHRNLNVILAEVSDSYNKSQDNHNLGKSFLVKIIDFMCLSRIDKTHPLKKTQNKDVFSGFVFFLEIQSNEGLFICIRRSIETSNSVCITTSTSSFHGLEELDPRKWEYSLLALKKAKEVLNYLLDLKAISSSLWDYRRGLGYFLREQDDYVDVFDIPSKFAKSSHIDWKPYVLHILGLQSGLFFKKFKLDKEIELLKKAKKEIEQISKLNADQYDELKGLIEIREIELNRKKEKANDFDLFDLEQEAGKDVIERIDKNISEYNNKLYLLEGEISDIEQGLKAELEFSVPKIEKIFNEALVYFSPEMMRNYQDLVEFNEKITVARQGRLQNLLTSLRREKEEILDSLKMLNEERKESLRSLQKVESMNKYKAFQEHIFQETLSLEKLKQELKSLGDVTAIKHQITKTQQELAEVRTKVEEEIHSISDIPLYKKIRQLFSEYAKEVLDVDAVINVPMNKNLNPDFKVAVYDRKYPEHETSEDRGNSYKKFLCVFYDLAILSAYANKSFFRFVYHDGVFEGLDDRRKLKLLTLIRKLCSVYDIQYIMTLIDSDLPRLEDGNIVNFEEEEIMLKLDDSGPSGRLFKCKIL